jgi:acyl-CoA reductase-like NAD-dependent aldehyde dehydrogenase
MTTSTQSSSQSHKIYISGAWVEGAKIAKDINPSDTNDVVGLYSYGDARQANAAVAATKDAFLAWSRSSIQLRHDILKRVGDEILARKDELGRLLGCRSLAGSQPALDSLWCGRKKD